MIILQSDMEDSNTLDVGNDHISEPFNHSDNESIETAHGAHDADEPEVLPQPDPARSRESGRWSCT